MAGPVVAAAVLLPEVLPPGLSGVRDSKLLSPERREEAYAAVLREAESVAVAWAHPREIERDNILAATLAAMRRAVGRLPGEGCLVAVDGNRRIPKLDRPQVTIVDGDALSLSIGAASIVAKVIRDRWMTRLDRRFPGYGLARHKGYGTPSHLEALSRLGPSPSHRRTFAPVAVLL